MGHLTPVAISTLGIVLAKLTKILQIAMLLNHLKKTVLNFHKGSQVSRVAMATIEVLRPEWVTG